MAKFQKVIVTEGVYRATDPDNNFAPVEAKITRQRIKHWVDTFRKMKAAGLKVPAPKRHNLSAIPVVDKDKLASVDDNMGFWEDLEYGVTTDPKTGKERAALIGIVDVDGDPFDPNSKAGLVGKSVRDTSVWAKKEWTDGSGKVWNDPILHAALVVNPIEPGQSNFELVGDESNFTIAMSSLDHDAPPPTENDVDVDTDKTKGSSTINLSELITLLRTTVEVDLPDDTQESNLIERLSIALRQKKPTDTGHSTTQPPPGSKEKEVDLIMAFSTQQIDSIVASNAINPATTKPYTKAELEALNTPANSGVAMSEAVQKQLDAQSKSNTILMSHLQNTRKQEYATRIQRALAVGQIPDQAYVDTHMKPLVDSFIMSFNEDGTIKPHPLDSMLAGIEALPARKKPNALKFAVNDNVNDALNALAMSAAGGVGFEEVELPEGAETVKDEDVINAMLS